MDDVANLPDPRLEHAVGGGVGDHDRRQSSGMLLRLQPQVGHVHVAIVIAGHHHYLHAGHHCARGVGAMRR